MKLFDTHAHYNDSKIYDTRKSLIQKSTLCGVEKIVNVADSLHSLSICADIASEYDFMYCTCGIHPSDAKTDMEQNPDWLSSIEKALKNTKAVAIGEIGLDYHYGKDDIEQQKICFAKQLELAQKTGYPVVVHDREAHEDTLELVFSFDNITSVFHSYSGSAQMAKELFKRGHYISVNGVVTFKNARKICEILQDIRSLHKNALSRLLIETDCPYLTPEPYRGQTNYSELIKYTAVKAASLVGMDTEDFCNLTYDNGCEFYKIKE